MKSTNTKWFTLVELIIVITILAILATIAFISFQGYSTEARDSRVKAELTNAMKVIMADQAKGNPINYLVTNDVNKPATLSVQGADLASSEYNAGVLNKNALELDSDNDYRMGYAGSSLYQLAWVVRAEGDLAYVVGNYNPRTAAASTATGTVTDNTTFTITSSADFGKLKVGDTVTDGTVTTTIVRISSDMATVTVGDTITGTTLTLPEDEDKALIANETASGTLIGGTDLPY